MVWPINAADLRKELRYTPEQGDPDELSLYAAAAVERIEEKTGKISGQILQVVAVGPTDVVAIGERAERLTSIVVNGESLDRSKFQLGIAGMVYGPFPAGEIIVRAIAPLSTSTTVVLAARRLAASWWMQSKNGPMGAGGSSNDVAMGVGIPRTVLAMLEGNDALAGIG